MQKDKPTTLNVGLTGGIGSGKSEVLTRLKALGATVVDADLAAREVVEPGTDGYDAVVEEFGSEVVGADGRLDRPKLGAIVFADPGRLAALNAIVHPRVGALMAEWADAAPEGGIVVYDIPLLVEGGADRGYAAVIVVDADEEVRYARLLANRGMSRADAAARMAAQASRQDRLAAADYVIANNGSLEDLDQETDRVWSELLTLRDSTIR
ncbi:dephospho-CoA kinase [Catenulispora acidiphila DSM 44928]|jgi:dephospho-CoA kinase|uniref:Dephospho-CoA kinase n=1 Tax=Catenulispora acidiphila (strain DSM 44928 / JCM 14897 / NBRC 102108 / NRRL B-24433 / ID139908) TaxID=479433 RepID=C7QC77_CATAD|nr:dephospho-CoA kinase [Catenulispora acidiphila]ACU74525.1 dephospho-CoA kinase [Catenulispora acidiphila DSM 44928]